MDLIISHLPKGFSSTPPNFALLLNNSQQYTVKLWYIPSKQQILSLSLHTFPFLPTIYLFSFKQEFSRVLSIGTVSNFSAALLHSLHYSYRLHCFGDTIPVNNLTAPNTVAAYPNSFYFTSQQHPSSFNFLTSHHLNFWFSFYNKKKFLPF